MWTFRKIITAKTDKEAKAKFKEALEDDGFRRWDAKMLSCGNTLQYPETWVIDYTGRKTRETK